MKRNITLTILLLNLLTPTIAADTDIVTYLWNMEDLVSLARKPSSAYYKEVVQYTEGILRQKPVAVTDKEVSLSGNKHNYESLSPYWWPDPKNPGGPYIARDGQTNPETKQYDSPRLITLRSNLVYCSKAFYITGDIRYYDYFCRQLDTWFIDKDTRMTPHFEYSQFVPGRNNGRGNPQGMSEAYNFNNILESIRLVNSVKDIGKKRMKALQAWFRDFAEWMQESDYGLGTQSFQNGQVLTFDTTLYNIFIFTGQKSERQAIFDAFPEKRVNKNIASDGKIPESLRRTKGFFYTVSSLQRFVDFATLAKADGNSLPGESIARIQKAFDYITQFEDNRSAFPYSEIGDWDDAVKQLEQVRKKFQRLKQ